MIFLTIAIAWLALIVLFVIIWARFGRRRRELEDSIERDRLQSHDLRAVKRDDDDDDDDEKQDPPDVA